MEDFPNTKVIELNTNNLDLNNQNTIVRVNHPAINRKNGILCGYAPWCGHCIRLKPILHQLSQIVDQHGIKISVFNADADPNSILSNIGLRYYPTLFWIKDNQELELFEPENRELPILLDEIKSKFGDFTAKAKKTKKTKKKKTSPKKKKTSPKKKKTSPKKKKTTPKKKKTSPKKKKTSPKKKKASSKKKKNSKK